MTDENDFHERLSFAAHELTTPLTLIKFYAEALKEADKTERDRFADNIMQLSHDLIESSRLLLKAYESQKTGCGEAATLNLKTEINEIIKSFTPLLEPKNISVNLEIPTELNATVCRAGLSIMVKNLLSNALKFSPHGSQITVSTTTQPLTLKIADQAEVIEAADREKIFTAFGKTPAGKKSNAGFGLGLYICQHVANLWQQRIWVEPAPSGKGNQFCFTLPE